MDEKLHYLQHEGPPFRIMPAFHGNFDRIEYLPVSFQLWITLPAIRILRR